MTSFWKRRRGHRNVGRTSNLTCHNGTVDTVIYSGISMHFCSKLLQLLSCQVPNVNYGGLQVLCAKASGHALWQGLARLRSVRQLNADDSYDSYDSWANGDSRFDQTVGPMRMHRKNARGSGATKTTLRKTSGHSVENHWSTTDGFVASKPLFDAGFQHPRLPGFFSSGKSSDSSVEIQGFLAPSLRT